MDRERKKAKGAALRRASAGAPAGAAGWLRWGCGWLAVRRSDRPASLLFTAHCTGDGGLAAFAAAFTRLRCALADPPARTAAAALHTVLAAPAELPLSLERRPLALAEHAAAADTLLAALRSAPVHAAVAPHVAPPWDPDAAALLVLALPADPWSALPADTAPTSTPSSPSTPSRPPSASCASTSTASSPTCALGPGGCASCT